MVYKGSPEQANLLRYASKVQAKLSCITPTVEKGDTGLFFAKEAKSLSGLIVVELTECDPNQPKSAVSSCQITELTQGIPCNTPPTPEPTNTCYSDCGGHDQGTRWFSGTFGCSECSCNTNVYLPGTCSTSCDTRYTCIMGPSVVGSGLVMLFLCVGIFIRRRKQASANDHIELSDLPASTNNFNYQPIPTNTNVGGSSVMMTTPAGQSVMVNTQPMVMMTQTGEPVVVQVAYV